jgi:hypothetical protein
MATDVNEAPRFQTDPKGGAAPYGTAAVNGRSINAVDRWFANQNRPVVAPPIAQQMTQVAQNFSNAFAAKPVLGAPKTYGTSIDATQVAGGDLKLPSETDYLQNIEYLQNNLSLTTEQTRQKFYGEPTNIDGVNVYSPKVPYIGLDQGQLSYGFLPAPRLPSALKENATRQEQKQYQDSLMNAVRFPAYKAGDDNKFWSGKTPEDVRKYQKAFQAAGLYDPQESVMPGRVGQREQEIITQIMGTANLEGSTVDQVLAEYSQRAMSQQAAAGGGGGGGGGNKDTTQIYYDQTSTANARQYLATTLQSALGRGASAQEFNQFLDLLRAAEAASPRIVKTSTRGDTTTSRSQVSDVDPTQIAEQFAEDMGGAQYDEFAYGNYFDIIRKLISGEGI